MPHLCAVGWLVFAVSLCGGCVTSAPAEATSSTDLVVLPNSMAVHASGSKVKAVGPDGVAAWELTLPDGDRIAAPMAAARNSHIYVRGQKALYAASPDGKWLWTKVLDSSPPAGRERFGAPVPMADSSVTILAGSKVVAIESDGKPRWDIPVPTGEMSAVPVGSDNGHLLIATSSGIYAVSATGEIAWRFAP